MSSGISCLSIKNSFKYRRLKCNFDTIVMCKNDYGWVKSWPKSGTRYVNDPQVYVKTIGLKVKLNHLISLTI